MQFTLDDIVADLIHSICDNQLLDIHDAGGDDGDHHDLPHKPMLECLLTSIPIGQCPPLSQPTGTITFTLEP